MPLDFDALVREHGSYIRLQVARIVGPEHADDVAQQTWIDVWRGLGSFRGDAKIRSWLHKCARNQSLTFLRRQRRHHVLRPLDALVGDGEIVRTEFVDAAALPDETVQTRDSWRIVKTQIDTLPPKYQAVLLSASLELTTREGAETLGITAGAYKSRLCEARKRLERPRRTRR